MTALPPPAPIKRPSFYAYVVIDSTAAELTPLAVKLSRSEAREFREWHPDADNLRVRRARVSLYQS
jgi:hypothetical protein